MSTSTPSPRPAPPALPRSDRAGPRAVQGEVHHRRRRRTAEGDPGDHPDQAQDRRQSAVHPHERPGFEFLLRLPQRSRSSGGSGDDVANVFVSEGFESAQFDNVDPSFSSERHTIALMGAGLVELLAREMTADLQAIRAGRGQAGVRSRARTCAPTSSARACGSAGSSPIPTASSTSIRSTASTPT